jgi:hypothetical protein
MIQMILEIDENADVSEFNDGLQKAIRLAKIQWPDAILAGTQPVDGKKLILILSQVDGETLQDWIDNGLPSEDPETGESVILPLGVDWQVVAEEGKKVDQSKLLPYFLPDFEFDEEGEVINEIPVTDLTGRLQTWAGRVWIY